MTPIPIGDWYWRCLAYNHIDPTQFRTVQSNLRYKLKAVLSFVFTYCLALYSSPVTLVNTPLQAIFYAGLIL